MAVDDPSPVPPVADDLWICPQCSTENDGNVVCAECEFARPPDPVAGLPEQETVTVTVIPTRAAVNALSEALKCGRAPAMLALEAAVPLLDARLEPDLSSRLEASEARARAAEEALERMREAANGYLAGQNFGGYKDGNYGHDEGCREARANLCGVLYDLNEAAESSIRGEQG